MDFYKINVYYYYNYKYHEITEYTMTKNIYFLMNKYGTDIFNFNIINQGIHYHSFIDLIINWMINLEKSNGKLFLTIFRFILLNKLSLTLKSKLFKCYRFTPFSHSKYAINIINLLNTKNIKFYIYYKEFSCLIKKYYKIRKIERINYFFPDKYKFIIYIL